MKDLYILFGPPGSGKTTQASFLAQQMKMDHISWGFIFRNRAMERAYRNKFSIIKRESTSVSERSRTIASIVEKEVSLLKKKRKERGLVLDGFPRRVEEGRALLRIAKRHGYRIKALIKINPSLETALRRTRNRRICRKCKTYYVDFMPSKKPNYCDNDGTRLVKSAVSDEEVRNDFFLYGKEVDPVIEYLSRYSEASFDVSGDDDDLVIFSNILIKLKNKVRTSHHIFRRQSSSILETKFGEFHLIAFQSRIDYTYHLALVHGKVGQKEGVLVRVHSSCVTGDIFNSLRCDCGDQLHHALRKIVSAKAGIVIYLFQEGRGINIINKIQAYRLQQGGFDTVEANESLGFPAEMRDYGIVRDILEDLKVKSIVLLTNNPDKVNKITDLGIIVEEIAPLEIEPGEHNRKYLATKKRKMNHRLFRV